MDNPIVAMGAAFLTAQLGEETIAGVIDSIDPAELDAWIAVAIDFLGRLRSDDAPELVATVAGAWLGTLDSDHERVELDGPAVNIDRAGFLAELVDSL